jgi:hypothetical protein
MIPEVYSPRTPGSLILLEMKGLKLPRELTNPHSAASGLAVHPGRKQRGLEKMDLDHVFVCTARDAPEAERLRELGLLEGTPNVHRGQGTANRRFFFANAMLELLWVRDESEAASQAVSRTGLLPRWRGRAETACGFGFCFRPSGARPDPTPFTTWDYHPPYLSPSIGIPVATNSAIVTEPMLFCLPSGERPDAAPPARRQPLRHPLGVREITRAELVSPHAERPSTELGAAVEAGLLALRRGREYRLEITFDRAARGREANLGPELPLVLRW